MTKSNRPKQKDLLAATHPEGMRRVGIEHVTPVDGNMGFVMEELPGGDIMLKRAVVVPMNKRLLDPAVHAELEAAREWRKNTPAKATDLAALGSKLGITEE